MVIVDSDGGGADVASTIGGVLRAVEGAEDVASGVGIIEGAAGAGGMISVGILTCCGYCGCSSCGISRCAGLVRALGGAT